MHTCTLFAEMNSWTETLLCPQVFQFFSRWQGWRSGEENHEVELLSPIYGIYWFTSKACRCSVLAHSQKNRLVWCWGTHGLCAGVRFSMNLRGLVFRRTFFRMFATSKWCVLLVWIMLLIICDLAHIEFLILWLVVWICVFIKTKQTKKSQPFPPKTLNKQVNKKPSNSPKTPQQNDQSKKTQLFTYFGYILFQHILIFLSPLDCHQ